VFEVITRARNEAYTPVIKCRWQELRLGKNADYVRKKLTIPWTFNENDGREAVHLVTRFNP